MTAPPVVVLRSEPEDIPEMAKFVEVALVPVAFTNVKFWRVEEPVVRRFESVERPFVAVSVPATERLPALSNVEVAEPPKYAASKTEKRVVDAWMKELAVGGVGGRVGIWSAARSVRGAGSWKASERVRDVPVKEPVSVPPVKRR